MTSPFGQSFTGGTNDSSNAINGSARVVATSLQQEFYSNALSMAMVTPASRGSTAGTGAIGGSVWPPGPASTVASGRLLGTEARVLNTGPSTSSPVPAWSMNASATFPTTTPFNQQQQRQQQQQQQRQPMWLGATATGPLPSRAIPGTPGGVPVQGNGFLCQPQTALAHQQQHHQQQQQSIAGFTTVETTSATMPNPIFALSSQGSDHRLGPFSGPNGAHAGMRLGSIFATPPNAVANGSQSGAVGSGALVVRPQQSSVFSTPVTGSSVFAPAGIGGTGVHPAAAAATAIAKAAAARGIDGNAAGIPFPRHSFLQLNPLYPGLRSLLESPPMYAVDDFFSPAECDALITLAGSFMMVSPVVGAGAGEVSESRTSSSCFLAREDLPTVCSKVMSLTGKPIDHLELPQVGRYFTTQKYANHWDAFDLATEDGRRFAQNGGQRVCTVLVYLNDVAAGGCTNFPHLGLRVQPKKGMAIVFFPATLGGILDPLVLHAAEPAMDTKWVSQIWIRQSTYSGTPTARIPRI